MNETYETSLEQGAKLIRRFVKTLPDTPGVYRMLDKDGGVLYVGKAKSLKKRVVSYANYGKLPLRLQRMVAATKDMMFVHTHTEVEALLLESNLIKKLKPRYNVLLRDDKSFPYILITGDHDFPLLTKHRGARKRKGDYFGPFASAGAVNRTLTALQKAFMLRNCTDSYFENRSRPCLQYHIKRCTAPCVAKVSTEEYAAQVKQAQNFLSGKSQGVQEELAQEMQTASDALDYERAAALRDRIKALTAIQAKQDINIAHVGDADVIGLYQEKGKTCVQVFFFRAGKNFGNHAYFPRHGEDENVANILGAFIAQFYENKPIPPDIIVSEKPADDVLLAQALNAKESVHRKVAISVPQRGDRKRLIDFVIRNAKEALERENIKQASAKKLLRDTAKVFDLDEIPQRIEIYDNSHISGTNMVGAMVVAGPEGFRKNAYRKFNIKQAAAADDFGMMREVLERRFGRALKEDKGPGSEDWPDILLIDGGQGQYNAVKEILEDLGVFDKMLLVSIAKGVDRHAGREHFFVEGKAPFQLPVHDPVLHYLQRLRDEAHRFAITTHRARRTKQISASPLDDVPGIGAKRKKALLLHFGSGKDVQNAGVQDLQKVDGVSADLAQKIYDYFHDETT
jgi:excinuclease ABC subunit C